MRINSHWFFAVAVDVRDVFLQHLCFTECLMSDLIWKCLLLYVVESFVMFAVSKHED